MVTLAHHLAPFGHLVVWQMFSSKQRNPQPWGFNVVGSRLWEGEKNEENPIKTAQKFGNLVGAVNKLLTHNIYTPTISKHKTLDDRMPYLLFDAARKWAIENRMSPPPPTQENRNYHQNSRTQVRLPWRQLHWFPPGRLIEKLWKNIGYLHI